MASRELVARRCALAARAGVEEGMDLAHARTLLPAGAAVHVEAHRPDRDGAALKSLAHWAIRFSPLVAPDPPDGLLIDVTGTERLHRGEPRLIRSVASGLARFGLHARIASASTFGCAWGVARFGNHALSRVPHGHERSAMEGLPVQALRIDSSTAAGLGEVGVTRVCHVLAIPRASLAARFDPLLLRRVLQALGEAGEIIDPVRPEPAARSEVAFDGPTDRWESVEAAARLTLEKLIVELARRERGVRRLDLELSRPHAPSEFVQINLSAASRSLKHLWSLLRSRLERIDLGAGAEGITLVASRSARVRHQQRTDRALGAPAETTAQVERGELIDALVGRLGADNIVRIEPVESHLPERAYRERSVMEAPSRAAPCATTGADRPTILFAKPEPASVIALTPDGPIRSLNWRGRSWEIAQCSRPERIGPEWWRWSPPAAPRSRGASRRRPAPGSAAPPSAPPDRDYFAAQTAEGRWLWVCRHVGAGGWFVHGEWS